MFLTKPQPCFTVFSSCRAPSKSRWGLCLGEFFFFFLRLSRGKVWQSAGGVYQAHRRNKVQSTAPSFKHMTNRGDPKWIECVILKRRGLTAGVIIPSQFMTHNLSERTAKPRGISVHPTDAWSASPGVNKTTVTCGFQDSEKYYLVTKKKRKKNPLKNLSVLWRN